MEWLHSFTPDFFEPYLLPVFIFLARITDVTIGTLRIVFLTQGRKKLATLLGLAEVTVWLLAVSSVIQNVSGPLNFIAYVAGYSTGSYLGMTIVERLALGNIILRLVTRKDATALIDHLYRHNYGLTVVDATGREGHVQILFMVIKRRELDEMVQIIHQYNPNAFFSIEDVQRVHDGSLPYVGAPVMRR
ncbi:MAG: DUF2179 domain-containing protein [Candidatus Hinthialibacter antarcticus]|nr:DUF2179 domain-containing protein [Candidatus Hinthialibacter antarcticus]